MKEGEKGERAKRAKGGISLSRPKLQGLRKKPFCHPERRDADLAPPRQEWRILGRCYSLRE